MEQNSGMFSKIKSLFIVDDGTKESKTNADKEVAKEIDSQPTNSRTSVESNSLPNQTSATSSSQLSDVGPDAKFTDLLLKAIEASNMEGFDYLEYKNSLRSVEKVIPDEGMRFKSAFEMAKTMGLTKDKLIQSATFYLNVLQTEDKKFKDAVENQKARQIQGRTDQIKALEQAIADKQQTIKKLEQEILDTKKQLDTSRAEINDAVVKIDVTNAQFVSSYKLVYGQIAEDIVKIKANL